MKRETVINALWACGARPCLRGEKSKIQFLAFKPSDPSHGDWGVTVITKREQTYFCENYTKGFVECLVGAGVPKEVVEKHLLGD